MTSPHREDPHLFYEWARAEQPVCYSETLGAWMVTRYDDLMTMVHDPDTYSSKNALPSIWDNPPEVVRELAGCVAEGSTIVNEDEPKHLPLRKVLDHAFSGRRIRAVLPLMTKRANELIDAFEPDRSADLLAQYSDPFVQAIVSAVFGIPDEDVAKVQSWTNDYVLLWNPLAPTPGKIEAARRLVEYEKYIAELIEDRKKHPREDFISDMVHGNGDAFPPMSYADIQYVFRGLRVAGYDTTRDTVTSAILLMLQHREHWDRACQDPKAIPRLVEETLRRDAPHRGLMRVTTRETELGGVTLPAGSALLLLFGSGNRDERKFPDPDAVDPDRANVREHLAFGNGIHQCPGNNLARTEVRVALETLTRRLPQIDLAPDYRPTYIASYFFRGLESLRVVW
ncbi:linalool 8-monooxygenase [Prauserella flavalba]|uniref:Linalool 8-monooxygenase n=2 Tax=Prauserella flavalba TaxID=1477506 RepID=A0A318LJD2_9PSEU|nr:linalool 8-monooxygenase [Prauserella flavalba]